MISNITNKQNTIYYWRILFTYLIAIFHFDCTYNLRGHFNIAHTGLYIGADYFFIVSGYLLYKTLKSNSDLSAPRYILNRIIKIYPAYLLCFLITLVIKVEGDFSNIISSIGRSVYEFLCLQAVGLDIGWDYINPISWYISVLFFASYFLFYLLKKHEDLSLNIVFPIFIIITYSWFYRMKGNIDVVVDFWGFYSNGMLMRGLSDMMFGIYAFHLSDILRKRYDIKSLRTLELLLYILVISYSLLRGYGNKDFILVIFLAIAVSISFIPMHINKISKKVLVLSEKTLPIYLIHEVFRTYIFPRTFGIPTSLDEKIFLLLIYLIVITVSGIVISHLSKYISNKLYSIFIEDDC